MELKNKFYPESSFGGFTNVDGTIMFYLHINELLSPDHIVLDVGCGRGEYQDDNINIRRNLRILTGKVNKVIGLDVDPKAAQNPNIDEFCLLSNASEKWPIDDEAVDLIIADWTLEHITDPDLFFSETQRVLKTGGYLFARTTNSWGYIAIVARLTPKIIRNKIIHFVQKDRKNEDIFPKYYTCNTIPKLRRLLKTYGLSGVVFGHSGSPEYLGFSYLTYLLGYIYDKCAPQVLRNALFVFAKKE